MSRLQVFKISRSVQLTECVLGLKFETEDPANKVKLNYAKQFPVLVALSVKYTNRGEGKEERVGYFKSTVQFLYDSFTPGGNMGICETLRDLDVPLPPMEMFRLVWSHWDVLSWESYSGQYKCYGWQYSMKYLDRITATFPNLRYHVFYQIRSWVAKRWVQVGLDLGFLPKQSNEENEINKA